MAAQKRQSAKSVYMNRLHDAQLHSETVKPSDTNTATQQDGETVEQLYSDTATQLHSETVKPSDSKTVKVDKKISFYLTPAQEEKLEELSYAYWQRTKKRVNRNDIVRYLIDHCDSDSLEGL